MSDWRDIAAASRKHAHSNPVDWTRLDAAIDRGLKHRQKRRRQWQAGGGLVLAAAVVVVSVILIRDPAPRLQEIVPAKPFTQASAQQLRNRCAATLPSGKATEQLVATNDSKTTAVALVRDADAAAYCVSSDANDSDVTPEQLPLTDRPPEDLTQEDWVLMRTSDRLTYIGVVTAQGGRGPFSGLGVNAGFGPRKLKENHRHTDSLNLSVLEIPQPLRSDGVIVLGLTDDDGCECGAVLELGDELFADTSPAP